MYYHVSIGSNIRPEKNIGSAVAELTLRMGSITLFPRVVTAAVDMIEVNDFINTAAIFESSLSPSQVKAILNEIERDLGRDRDDPLCSVKNRCCDIDIFQVLDTPQPKSFLASDESYVKAVFTSNRYAAIHCDHFDLSDGSSTVNLQTTTGNKLVIN
ncbi:2-amino-4-hydroxy-6-hydroxymethyldihydropteridine diphosphokinase [uncultured Umboniibacter sp.]|uniref:2-amino-4-hydroxy-6- hydroxymethyldihydropteridine diphosphokinase n=1 Tax=uncultured Umboniibacter sp. TaxID=1798917 RepID=UPI00262EAA23|nr:2-amino-4-hydroxy-6-hydroxymethyldihydropteridine diphosphokinase [uncultured Umboniibacter sp.]